MATANITLRLGGLLACAAMNLGAETDTLSDDYATRHVAPPANQQTIVHDLTRWKFQRHMLMFDALSSVGGEAALSPIEYPLVNAVCLSQTGHVLRVSLMSPPSASPDPSSSVDQARWFDDEVRPHETSLRSYLKGSFPGMRDVDDVVQESYLRICKAHAAHPIQCARAFLFGIARRLAVDVIRKERRTTAHNVSLDFGAFDVREDKVDAAEAASTQQEIELLAEAMHALPARCREVMVLRKIERLSHREIADKLGITIGTVEAQIARGMEKCTCYLRSRGVSIVPRGSSP